MKSRLRISEIFREIGPGALVTAAFIGPGTLTACTLAGAAWGYSLLWGLLFSVVATVVLQEMASRLGIVGRKSLGEAISLSFRNPIAKIIAILLVILAIGIGNAAYESGNIAGAAMGLESVTGLDTFLIGGKPLRIWPLLTGLMAFSLLYSGSYRVIEKILITLVIIMSITFITTAILVKPSISEVARGLFIPSVPKGSIIMLIGLIGTTIVPYNLFLHASTSREKWKSKADIGKSRLDSAIAIGIGGIISGAIVVTSSVTFSGTGREITGIAELGEQLEPLLGPVSKYFMAAGIFSAGVSSAVTAPLAAAYAITGVLGLESGMRSNYFRAVWIMVLITGVIFATFGLRPIRMILLAQFTNGLLLPILAAFLLKVMNNREILGPASNSRLHNIIGILIILVTFLLGLKSIGSLTGLI
ncbi:MAG: Nramp family divalent metal transporter [Bacteroidales bacterium]|nr:Nramp family divalent metal transporter [Bacteroidales bacterium]